MSKGGAVTILTLLLVGCSDDYPEKVYPEVISYMPTLCDRNDGMKYGTIDHRIHGIYGGLQNHSWDLQVTCVDGAMFSRYYELKKPFRD